MNSLYRAFCHLDEGHEEPVPVEVQPGEVAEEVVNDTDNLRFWTTRRRARQPVSLHQRKLLRKAIVS